MNIEYYQEASRRHLIDGGKHWLPAMSHIAPIVAGLPIESVIDFGCSSGYFLETLAYSQKYGYETDKLALNVAKGKGLQVTSDWASLPMVDCILVIDVVEHFDKDILLQWIPRWREQLSTAGYLFVQTDNPYCLPSAMEFWDDWTHVRMWGPKVLTNLLELGGFKLVKSGRCYGMLRADRRARLLKKLASFLVPARFLEEYGKYWLLLQKADGLPS